jgi:DNA-binding MarR family transcriptional regulator
MSPFESVEEAQEDEQAVDIDLIWLVSQVTAILRQIMQQELKNSPISVDGLWFLAIIMMLGDSATPSQLAQWMVRKPNTISAMTTRLQEKGFVEKQRTKGTNNRACLRIVLTEKGKQALKMIMGTTLIPGVYSEFTLQEKRQFRSLLFKARGAASRRIKDYMEPPFPSAGTPSLYWERVT